MVSVLRVHFNSLIKTSFTIEDPAVMPLEGEVISFSWADFLDNADDVKILEAYELDDLLICNVLSRMYYKDKVETLVVLFEREHYNQFMKRLKE